MIVNLVRLAITVWLLGIGLLLMALGVLGFGGIMALGVLAVAAGGLLGLTVRSMPPQR